MLESRNPLEEISEKLNNITIILTNISQNLAHENHCVDSFGIDDIGLSDEEFNEYFDDFGKTESEDNKKSENKFNEIMKFFNHRGPQYGIKEWDEVDYLQEIADHVGTCFYVDAEIFGRKVIGFKITGYNKAPLDERYKASMQVVELWEDYETGSDITTGVSRTTYWFNGSLGSTPRQLYDDFINFTSKFKLIDEPEFDSLIEAKINRMK